MKKLLNIIFALLLTIILLPISVINNEIKADGNDDNYLTFTAEQAQSSVTFNYLSASNSVMYKTKISGVETGWSEYTAETEITLANIGDEVSFKGKDVKTNSTKHFTIHGKVKASGDVTSLTNGSGGDATLTAYCYQYMFDSCDGLTSAPNLPSTTLSEGCYMGMFKNCTKLTSAPELNAQNLNKYCYQSMFGDCTSLETAPSLPATTLAESCYCMMFAGCAKLTTTPELKATVLVKDCYHTMFQNCTGLTSPVDLKHVTSLAAGSCAYMYGNCSNLKVYKTKFTHYMVKWSVGSKDTSVASGWNTGMFQNIKEEISEPELAKTYYIAGDGLKLTYDKNGATSGDVPSVAYYVEGDTVTVLGNTGSLAKTAYNFDGWNTKADGSGTDYKAKDTFTIEADTTLYAKWTPIEYTITYHLDGGTEETNPTSYTIESEDIELNDPIKDGYFFAGFYNNDKFEGEQITTIPKGSTGNLDLYAKWLNVFAYTITDEINTTYDGKPHSVEVKVSKPTTGYTVYYSLDGGTKWEEGSKYSLTDITPNTVSVVFKIEATGYVTTIEATSIKINPQLLSKTTPTFNGINGKISYTKGQTKDCIIEIDRKYNDYVKEHTEIYLNDSTTPLSKDYYEIDSGSTILTLKDTYLNTLKTGTYTYKINFNYSKDETYSYNLVITIQSPTPTPYIPVDTASK